MSATEFNKRDWDDCRVGGELLEVKLLTEALQLLWALSYIEFVITLACWFDWEVVSLCWLFCGGKPMMPLILFYRLLWLLLFVVILILLLIGTLSSAVPLLFLVFFLVLPSLLILFRVEFADASTATHIFVTQPLLAIPAKLVVVTWLIRRFTLVCCLELKRVMAALSEWSLSYYTTFTSFIASLRGLPNIMTYWR